MDFWYIIAFLAGIFATLLFFWASERRAKSMRAADYQKKGVAVKEEQSVRLMAFLSELKLAYDEESASGQVDLKKFATAKVLPIALKYPDVVAKHGKKLWELFQNGKGGKSGAFDISSLLGGGMGGL